MNAGTFGTALHLSHLQGESPNPPQPRAILACRGAYRGLGYALLFQGAFVLLGMGGWELWHLLR